MTVADGFARLGFLPYGAEAAAQAAEIFAAQQGPGSAAARRATARATELSLQCQHLDSPAVQRFIAPELSTRDVNLAPPSTVSQLVERHGLFDAAFGPQATRQTRDRMLALASRESGAFSDPVVPRPGGGTMPWLTVVDPGGSPATLPLPPGQALPAGQYLVHDTDNPVVPHLIDPGAGAGAGGATLAPVPGQPATAGSAPVTVAYSGQWPDQVPAELRLVAGGPAGQGRSPVLAADTAGRGALTGTLPPAGEARLLLSSALAAAVLDVMDPITGSVRDAALSGLVPLFGPTQPITVLHATRRPLKQMTWRDTAVTITGPTRVRFAATATAHRPSTAGLDIVASWEEIIDPGFGPVTTVPRSAVLGSMDVPSDGTEPLAWNKEYDFGDTQRRDLSLSVIGSTRYRDCFPELTEGDPRGQRVLSVPSKTRKNTRRPEPPEVAAIVPTYPLGAQHRGRGLHQHTGTSRGMAATTATTLDDHRSR